MCAIAGILHLDGRPVDRSLLASMAWVQRHRGPDDQGVFQEDGVGLSHRRLAILDPGPRGAQPMFSQSGRWVVVYNGFTYNFPQMRQRIEEKGQVLRTTTDTEVWSEGLAAFGPDFIKQALGMFAFAAWDREEQCLYLGRDRHGTKPLYYWHQGSTLVFASEIKAILRHPAYQTQVNLKALNQYFTFQNVFTDHTLFDGIKTLMPGHRLVASVRRGQVDIESWWDYDFSSPDESLDFATSVDLTRQAMVKAVSRQMVSDLPLGTYLSGGMDSGSITALAARQQPGLPSFTAGFDLSSVEGIEAHYDERQEAAETAEWLGTEHHEQVIFARDLATAMPRLIWHMEDLRVGMSYPMYYISRLASQRVRVCLQGTGGDELFGGYPWRYYRVFRSLDQQAFFDQYYDFWQRLTPDHEKAQLFQPSIWGQLDAQYTRSVFEGVFLRNPHLQYETPEDHIANSLYFEMKTFLPGLLSVGDRLSMAHGLEERFPFLDQDLVDLAMKIPVRHKLGDLQEMKRLDENEAGNKFRVYRANSNGKNVLRKAMSTYLPIQITRRQKQGFSAPDASWYRGANAGYVKQLLLDSDSACLEFLNKRYLSRIIQEHTESKENHRLLIWSLLSFEWWLRIFLRHEQIPEDGTF